MYIENTDAYQVRYVTTMFVDAVTTKFAVAYLVVASKDYAKALVQEFCIITCKGFIYLSSVLPYILSGL